MHDILIDGLAFIGAISCLNWLLKAIRARMAGGVSSPPADAGADAAPTGPASEDIAAITAAIHAIVGSHRIVGIEAAEPAAADLAAITAAMYAVVGPHRLVGIEAAEPANDDDVAAITAAVYAVMEAPHRIVHIENGSQAQTWAAEGRWMHQTSHRPH